MHGGGFVATGHSASAPGPTSSSAPLSSQRASQLKRTRRASRVNGRRLARQIAEIAAASPRFAFAPLYRRVHLRWGATDAEVTAPMPGDELVPEPSFSATRAITIDAPPEAVWPWLVQLGYGRAGFYS